MEKEPTSLRPAKIVLAQERLNIQTDLSEQELDTVVEFLSKKIDKYIGEGGCGDSNIRSLIKFI